MAKLELRADPKSPSWLRPAAAVGAQGSVLYSILGTHRWDELGVSFALVGDSDDDGAPDFVAGAGQELAGKPEDPPGHVLLVSGKSGQAIHTWKGDSPSASFGRWIVPLGDVDGD